MKKRHLNQQGTFTVWALGLCITLFMIGGISVDLWRAFAARRALTEVADSAARNGANNINIEQRELYGTIALDGPAATNAAEQSINDNANLNNINITSSRVNVDVATNEVDVEVNSNFSFFLLGFFPGGDDTNMVARARATPVEGQ